MSCNGKGAVLGNTEYEYFCLHGGGGIGRFIGSTWYDHGRLGAVVKGYRQYLVWLFVLGWIGKGLQAILSMVIRVWTL